MKDKCDWKLEAIKLREHFEYYSTQGFEKYLNYVRNDLLKIYPPKTVQKIMVTMRRRIK